MLFDEADSYFLHQKQYREAGKCQFSGQRCVKLLGRLLISKKISADFCLCLFKKIVFFAMVACFFSTGAF